MTIRTIITAPDPFLRTKSKPVPEVDDGVRVLFDDMLQTMYDAPGIGLSAIQIGVAKRLVVVDVHDAEAPPAPLFLANPEIIWQSEDLVNYEEGCLSLPEHFAEVVRAQAVDIRYLDRTGEPQTERFDGLLATCLQHEIDHLDGRLFVDHISALKRNMIMRKLRKAKRVAVNA